MVPVKAAVTVVRTVEFEEHGDSTATWDNLWRAGLNDDDNLMSFQVLAIDGQVIRRGGARGAHEVVACAQRMEKDFFKHHRQLDGGEWPTSYRQVVLEEIHQNQKKHNTALEKFVAKDYEFTSRDRKLDREVDFHAQLEPTKQHELRADWHSAESGILAKEAQKLGQTLEEIAMSRIRMNLKRSEEEYFEDQHQQSEVGQDEHEQEAAIDQIAKREPSTRKWTTPRQEPTELTMRGGEVEMDRLNLGRFRAQGNPFDRTATANATERAHFPSFLCGERESRQSQAQVDYMRETLQAKRTQTETYEQESFSSRSQVATTTAAMTLDAPRALTEQLSRKKSSRRSRQSDHGPFQSTSNYLVNQQQQNAGKVKGPAFKQPLHYKEGAVIGGRAPEIGKDNRGRVLLEKMGWRKGMPLGGENGNGATNPALVKQVMKITRAGLGW